MNWKACLAEFVGTFALCFVAVLAAVNAPDDLHMIAIANGFVIAAMASATMAVSGGHINPAVTIGFLATGRIALAPALLYIAAQVAGAFAAVVALEFAVGSEALSAVSHGATVVQPGLGQGQAFVLEFCATFMLMFVIFGTAVDKRGPKVGALFIGLAVTMGILAIGPQTGGAMNPARWLGPSTMGGALGHPLVYVGGTVAGAVAAALFYHHMLDVRPWQKESAAAEEISA